MCAIEAGKRGRSVLVLERNEAVGRKIRISGGGRCNFTNLHTTSDHFISADANFHKSALARYTPEDFIRMLRRHRIAYHEKKLGQLFCDGSSQQIINMLLNECDAAGVPIQTSCSVRGIEKGAGFRVATNGGEFECRSLVIATGGLSIPKIGSTDFGYRIARRFVRKWRELYGPQPLESWTFVPSGTEGYAKAEVTVGGVDTAALSSKTMEARNVPGLYFIGEVVDVTGHLGGFNFQWAWASGWVAGQYV